MNITFTSPAALVGLLTLPIIALLHMLRSRNRVYPVSSLTLWQFLNPQLSGTSARRLPLTWLLLIDLLIAALLSFALAGPNLDLTRTINEGRHLVLLIDSSISMASTDERSSRYEAASTDLIELATQNQENDAVTIISFTDTASTLADSRAPNFSENLSDFRNRLPNGKGNNLQAALALANASIDPDLPAEIHIFTDAAFPAPDFSEYTFPLEWHLYGSSENNQAILTLSAERLSNARYQVFTRAANFNQASVSRTLILTADGIDLATVEVNLDPESTLAQTWEVTGSSSRISVRLDGADDLALDDAAYTVMNTGDENMEEGRQIDIALVTEQPGPMLRALQAAPNTNVQVIDPDDYLVGSPFDLVVFQRFLPARWPGNFAVIVDPPLESDLLGVVSGFPITDIPFPQPDKLLADIDFSGIRWETGWMVEKMPSGISPVLSTGSAPLILHGQTGLTKLYVILAQTSDENGTPSAFARHPAFPVLMSNIVREAEGIQSPSHISLGDSIQLPLANRYPVINVVFPDDSTIEIESDAPNFLETNQVGFHEVRISDLEGKDSNFSFGVNAGGLKESNIQSGDWPSQIESPVAPAATTEHPISLVPWLLAAVGILLLLEAWLAWR